MLVCLCVSVHWECRLWVHLYFSRVTQLDWFSKCYVNGRTCCFIRCGCQDLFKTACISINLFSWIISLESQGCIHTVEEFGRILVLFYLRFAFHTVYYLLMAVHILPMHTLTSISVDEILLLRYINYIDTWNTQFYWGTFKVYSCKYLLIRCLKLNVRLTHLHIENVSAFLFRNYNTVCSWSLKLCNNWNLQRIIHNCFYTIFQTDFRGIYNSWFGFPVNYCRLCNQLNKHASIIFRILKVSQDF